MTITTSEEAAVELYQETLAQARHPDSTDRHDRLLVYPAWLWEGHMREVELREGFEVQIHHYRLRDRWDAVLPERAEWLSFHFHLSGQHQDTYTEVHNLEYALYGSGLAPKDCIIGTDRHPILEVHIWLSPSVFQSFAGQDGELPPTLRHLVRPADQLYYTRVGKVSRTMQRVLWQIIRCPYQGITKRLFLESKALEAVMLVLADELKIQQEQQPTPRPAETWEGGAALANLKPDDIDRLHQARSILLQHLEQPPSLMTLAQRVGLNSRALKEGFRQVFGQPPFTYLHDHRLEQARQLLETGDLKVSEVAAAVGFGDRSHFAKQFRTKFGINPKLYQAQRKKFC
ncbi:MAG: AraC family transcriptional regulator [Limnothrix sp. CACIAM 69d]|nr:MAG: AraC family transcriptional regulator [Limnothrix sp. CACIAM 69d]